MGVIGITIPERPDAGGDTAAVLSSNSAGQPTEEAQYTFAGTQTSDWLCSYLPGTHPNAALLSTVIERARNSSGNWQTIRQTSYAYYDGTQSHGNLGDLMTETITDGSDGNETITYANGYDQTILSNFHSRWARQRNLSD